MSSYTCQNRAYKQHFNIICLNFNIVCLKIHLIYGRIIKNELPQNGGGKYEAHDMSFYLLNLKMRYAEASRKGTVAYCGTSLLGNFVWSLTITDIF
jgi:hypothetical protein